MEPWREKADGFYFGFLEQPRGARRWLIDRTGKASLLFGPPGWGKATDILIPSILAGGGGMPDLPYSLFVFDPKNELYLVCAKQLRKLGFKVHLIAPFPGGLRDWTHEDMRTARINLLALLPEPTDPDCLNQINAMVEGIVLPDSGGNAVYFTEGARKLVAAVILFVRTLSEDLRNFRSVYRILQSRGDAFLDYCRHMQNTGLFECHAAAAAYLTEHPTEGALGILETAAVHSAFLGVPALQDVLCGASDFTWDDLRRGNVAVFVGMPDVESKLYGRFPRMFFASGLKACMTPPPGAFVRWIVDEAGTALAGSSLALLEVAMELGRASRVAIAPLVFQNLPQARTVLGKNNVDKVIASAATVCFLTPNDLETAGYVTRRASMRSAVDLAYAIDPHDPMRLMRSWQPSASGHRIRVPVIPEHHLFGMRRDRMVLFREGFAPAIVAQRAPYFVLDEMKHLANVSPYAPAQAQRVGP